MAFKRAQWHSGLTYQQKCHTCGSVVKYTDYNMDYRPWYADGFVYCPKCKTPLRHNENYAVDENGNYINGPQAAPQPAAASAHLGGEVSADGTFAYCTNCGRKYTVGEDRFCASCGKKLTED